MIMCGRYSLSIPVAEFIKRFMIQEVMTSSEARYNIAPSDMVPIVCNEIISSTDDEYVRTARSAKWGLIPFWAKNLQKHKLIINARAESLLEKTSFRYSFQKKRCLVPSDGFYEWKKGKTTNTPMHIKLKSGKVFAFAGLWDNCLTSDGEVIRTFAVITVPASKRFSEIHDRMPTILTPDAETLWLDPDAEPEELLPLLKPYLDEDMDVYPVSSIVNSPKVDSPECIQPVETSILAEESIQSSSVKVSRKKKISESDSVQLQLDLFS
jgi:putative SOS response-associated peptidase YedK